MAETKHPTRQPIALRIIKDSTPVEQAPQDIVTSLRFMGHLTEEYPKDQLEKEERKHDISALLQHVETDVVCIENPWFSQAFATAESYQLEYQTSAEYNLALHYLKRLYIIREQTQPLRITRNYGGDNDLFSNFATVLRHVIEEL